MNEVGELLPDGRTLYRLQSRKSLELSLSTVAPSGSIEVFPQVEERGLLFLQFRRRRVILTAGPYIGIIPLTPQISVDVRPKLPVSNLSRVLDIAHRSLSLLPNASRLYLNDTLGSASVLEFLALNFRDSLMPIIEGGFLKSYQPKSHISGNPRGRLELNGTLRAWAKGQRHLAQTSTFEQTSDVPVNRILKAALQHVLLRMQPTSDEKKKLIRSVNLTYGSFPSVIGGLRIPDLEAVRGDIAGLRFPQQRAYYYRATEIALMILSGTGISLDTTGEDVSLSSFIVNFDEIFEEYARRVLQLRRPNHVFVRDGNRDGKRPLFDNKKGQLAQPDIVLGIAGARSLIIEVKYKDKPNRDDINQAVTYAICYRTNIVVLVHQCDGDSTRGLYDIGKIDHVDVKGYGIDLGAEDLHSEESSFSSSIFGLVPINN
ncbi:McrC family protein [Novosphingobium sp. AAP83]|uniref:McrC family protein n=1 Tax=Novosphingobium sp. AAP83 TaxID=1523425 RepID=UPI0018D15A51|nr:hypothetical protein [Novosphingobium sp. AAP83]